jgi:hypothetical protein
MRSAALCSHPMRSRALRVAVQLTLIAISADAHLLNLPAALQQSPRLLGHRHADRARLSGQTTRSRSPLIGASRCAWSPAEGSRPTSEPSPFQQLTRYADIAGAVCTEFGNTVATS